MFDGVLLVKELIYLAARSKKNYMLFKVDFEKAYDNASWNFLRDMLKSMGFESKWLQWMEASVITSHVSILVNEIPKKEFKVERGLRQGDPLSPFLFVVVAECLTGLVKKVVDLGEI